MFKKSLVWLLIVVTVLLMALPMTVFANEGENTATVSDDGSESHEHTWVEDTNDADDIVARCSGCNDVQKFVTVATTTNTVKDAEANPLEFTEGDVTVKVDKTNATYFEFDANRTRTRNATFSISADGGMIYKVVWKMYTGTTTYGNDRSKVETDLKNKEFLADYAWSFDNETVTKYSLLTLEPGAPVDEVAWTGTGNRVNMDAFTVYYITHGHAWVEDTNDADDIVARCSGCNGVQKFVEIATTSGTAKDPEADILEFTEGDVTVKVDKTNATYFEFGGTARIRSRGATFSISADGGMICKVVWKMPTGTSAYDGDRTKVETDLKNKEFLADYTWSFDNETVTKYSLLTLEPGAPVDEVAWTGTGNRVNMDAFTVYYITELHDEQPACTHENTTTTNTATCTENGVITVTCDDCDEVVSEEASSALGHTAGAAADCENDQTCTVCGEVLANKLGHAWVDATYEAPKTCSVCGATEGEPLAPALPAEPTITGAKVNVGENLAIKYHVYIPDGEYTSVILKVTNEGHNTYAELEGTLVEDGTYVFVYDNIAPQCMSDLLDAYLIIDGETVATVEDYSIVQNAKNLANDNPEDTELKQFLADLLAYGMAAQLYTGYEVTITKADIAAIGAASNAAPAESSVSLGDRTAPDKAYIAGAGVRFDSEVQIFVAIAGANASEAKVVVNGEKYDVVDGKAYLPAMSLTELSASVEIALELDGEPVHTVTYGFYTYAYQMSIAGDAAMANLAVALYNCAESAKAYLN